MQKCKQQQVSQGCKTRISLFGRVQKAEFRHEAEKFHPCILSDRYQSTVVSVVEVSFDWATGKELTKLLGTWKATQLNVLCQESGIPWFLLCFSAFCCSLSKWSFCLIRPFNFVLSISLLNWNHYNWICLGSG